MGDDAQYDGSIASDPTLSREVIDAVTEWDCETTDDTKEEEAFEVYDKYILKKWLFIAGCVLITITVMGIALTVGEYDIKFLESYELLWHHICGDVSEANDLKDYIVVNLRMPRIVAGVIAGIGLAVAGVVMQSTLMNPLADPYTTGVSSGASFGATIAITAGATIVSGQYAIVTNAFLFALIPTAVILLVSKLKNASPTTMIMSGIAIMYIFNACTTVLMLWSDPNDMAAVYEWQVGTLAKASWDEIPIMLTVTLIGTILLQSLSRKLNVLSAGDDLANSLGIDANKLRMVMMIIVALMSASIVSFTGLIGFVGLVAPHVVRLFIGSDNRYLIPAAAIFGAMLLVVADLVGRTIISPATLQVGVVMAFLGGPVFLWLIVRNKSQVWG